MTGNISYLFDYEPFDGGYVSFGQGGCKITNKGTIKTGKLEFKNVYFVKDLKYNLFSVSQIYDNKNSVLFTDSECIVLGQNFKLSDDDNVLLRTPRQHNMYSFDLNNIVPYKDLTCLVAKASTDECMLWHRRLGNQHKAFCKSKLVNSVSKPLHTLHMDLFGPTSDETSGILRKFITEIKNLKDLKVKIIRCNNGGEFRNKEMNDFFSQKGIKREFSNARTPQQNGVAERRNRTLIEAARIMLVDAKLPVTFWAEAVNIACYVQNRRTKRVEENLDVEFLENKAIEKGAGPNWLFNIDSLTKSMNYVPVDAGTNSTNLSGTKDAASQEVKKDVSSLRYIAPPNWVYDALLESSSSKPQDDCSTDVPKSSGNSNPTATSTNPPVDYLETLTGKTPIPTVSSPVPTACLNDSLEPSNLLTKPFDAGRFQYLVYKLFLLLGKLFTVSVFLGFGLTFAGTSKYWYVLRILMISLRLNPLKRVNFHPIVDFVEASPLRYALTVKPTVYVSHIRHFWSTARIETTEKGTKILATVDGILRTVTESSLRRNLKLQDEEGISSLPDTELFENLTLMGYNISPNQKFTFQKGQFSHQWKYLIHTIMQCLSPKSTWFNEFSSNIATALVCLATNRTYNFSKLIFDGLLKNVNNKGEGSGTPTEPHHTPSPEAQQTLHTTHSSPTHPPVTTASIPTVTPSETTPIRQYTQRARIAQSSALPPIADEPASPLFKARVKLFEDREGVAVERSKDDAPIKGMNLDEGEAAAERVSDDTEEMETVLTSMDVTNVLASGVADVPTGSGSIPTAGPPAAKVPTTSPIFTNATVVTPYTRRKGKETMVESKTLKKKRIQEQMDIQMARQLEEEMERDAQRMNEQIARDVEIKRIHAKEELQIMIDRLDRNNYAKVHKFQTQQRKPWSKKQKRDYYMAVIRSNLGWKEEAKRFKRKEIWFKQESVKKLKTSEEVPEEVKTLDEVPKEKVKEMMQLVSIKEVYVEALQVKHLIIDWKVHTEGQRSYWTITRLGGRSASYQFFIDLLKHLDREDLNQLWALVKESLSNRPPTSDKEIELWVEIKSLYEPNDEDQLWTHTQNLMRAPVKWKLYDMCGVHQVTFKDKEIFMLVEKDYPFRKGLEIRMISYKLQVENYSTMANDLILKIYKIASTPSQQVIEFPLAKEVPSVSEESSHCQKKRDATAKRIALLSRIVPLFDTMLVPQGEGSGTPTEPHHTPSPEAQHTSYSTHSSPTLPPVTTAPIPTVTPSDTPPLRQYTRRTRIAQSSVLPPVADEPASPFKDVSEGEACPTDSGFGTDQDRANIAKTFTLPHDSAPRVTSPAADEGSMQLKLDELTSLCTSLQRQHSEMVSKFEAQELKITSLKARVKLLEDREGLDAERSGVDTLIKGRNLDEGEATAERVSDETEEMATVLTSIDASTVLASGVAEVSTGSGSIPTAGPPAAEVPTGSNVVPTAGLIFATATVVTLYTKRKGKETMVESETPKKKKIQEHMDIQMARQLEEEMERDAQRMNEQITRDAEIARIPAEEELQIMIDGLDRSNETVAKYLQEYHQFATELPLERRIELISDLVRYQDNYAKVHKFQTQQRKPWSKKQKRDYYMTVIKSNLGWKVKDFRGMTFEEIEAKFTTVWKQLEDFIPMGSKEEAERLKRKGLSLEQESVKKLKTSEEVPKEVKSPDEVPEEKTHTQNLMHAPVEWKLYDTCRVYHVTAKDKEIFMLVEKDYPLRKGLAIGMISYKLQGRIVENKMHKVFPLPVIEFPLPEAVPTARRKEKPLL
nr:hypothetical protein [Tanacetum cinerariifolium]